MMADDGYQDHPGQPSHDELVVPFLFVPHGQEPSPGWLAEHPGALRITATLVPQPGGGRSVRFNQGAALNRMWQAASKPGGR